MKIPSLKTLIGCISVLAVGASTSLLAQTTNAPVLHLSFDNVSGTTVFNDGSGSGMDGTLNGGATITNGGKFGNCLRVTGSASSDASCRIASAVVPLNVQAGSAWSVACWIKTSTKGATWMYQGDGGWANHNTTFFTALNNGSAGNASDAAGGVRYAAGWEQGTTTVDDGNWHHIVLTWDGTNKVQYVDGVVDTWVADQWANATGVGGQFWVGGGGTGQGDGQVCLNGLIDEAYVFDVALTASDVTKLHDNNSLTAIPVPVVVTVSPDRGLRGTTVAITATATPASGTVTNAVADLSVFGLTNAFQLVQSSLNVFTNSFTVPNNNKAPIGLQHVKVTVTDTEPLVGSGATNFYVLAVPPTNATVVAQLTSKTVYAYTEVSFHFAATNDAPNSTNNAFFPMAYAWYTNGVPVSTNAMGPDYTFLAALDQNNLPVQCVATIADNTNYYSSLSVTSALVSLTVNTGTPVYTNGLKQEFFSGAVRADVELGNVHPGVITVVTNADSTGGLGDNHVRRYSGFFIPPSNDNYVFFVASDDDCDLFLSTDSTMGNKQLIAQEAGWSGTRNWQTAGGGGSVATQKRSDKWTNSVGATPYSSGIALQAGTPYYFEAVMHNGGGGDNWGVTYETETELTADSTQPLDGSESRMTAASNNIAVITWPGTVVNFALQPKSSVSVYQGFNTNWTCSATNDAETIPTYQWYLNGAAYAGATRTNFSLLAIDTNLNNATIYVVAQNEETGLAVTSSVSTLHVLQSVIEVGYLKDERWANQTSLANLEAGALATPDYTMAVPLSSVTYNNPSLTANFVRRVSGYLIAPATTNYTFYTTGDDDSDLFLSTNNTPAAKTKVCSQGGWNNGANWPWMTVNSGGSTNQTQSSTWTNSSGVAPWAAGIPLIQGNSYFIEQDWHQGGGGANNSFTYVYFTEPIPPRGSMPRMRGTNIAMSAVRCTYVNFIQQPTNTAGPIMGYVTFVANGVTDSTTPIGTGTTDEATLTTNNLITYQWYKDGVPIAGANSGSLKIGPLLPSDNNSQIYVKMRALGYADNNLNPIWTSNSLSATLTVVGTAVYEPGMVQVQWWTNSVSRTALEGGTAGNPSYTYTSPELEAPTTSQYDNYGNQIICMFTPTNTANLGTNSYVFFINTDDDGDLFLSTDSSPINKRLIAQESGWGSSLNTWNAVGGGGSVVANIRSDTFTDPTSGNQLYAAGIPLVTGQKYYLEVDHHEGGGGDYAQVNYKLTTEPDPANGTDTRIGGSMIGFYAAKVPNTNIAFVTQPVSQTAVSGGGSVSFSVVGTNYAPVSQTILIGGTGNPAPWFTNPAPYSLQYQWFTNGVAVGGATGYGFSLPYVLPTWQHMQVVCGIRVLGFANSLGVPIFSNSQPAVLTVITDTVPPLVTGVVYVQNTNQNPPQFIVDVTFNKGMDAASVAAIGHYTGISGITNASLAPNHRSVQLLLSAAPTLPLNLTVNGVLDLSGIAVASTNKAIVADTLNFSDVGTAPEVTDPAYPSFVWSEGNGSWLVSAEGSDIWNANDGFCYGWEWKTNDFDVVVRGVSQGHTSNYGKMGLMAREPGYDSESFQNIAMSAGDREFSAVNDPATADNIAAPDGSYGQNVTEFNARTISGATSFTWDTTRTNVPAYPNAWLRLKRTGEVFDGYFSSNGSNWVHAAHNDQTTNDTAGYPWPVVMRVGICVTAHNNDATTGTLPPPFYYYNTAEFANYNSSYVYIPPPAQLALRQSGTNVIVTWTPAEGRLLGSPALSGPGVNWQLVSTNSPATIGIGAGAEFFKVENP